ncbi:MAG: thioesterase family protein [Betaproteobacteria bacterium]|nr:thioesterase family protein [Betaproteobacteria bacterium]
MNNHPQSPLKVGLRHTEQLRVEPCHTVPQVETRWPGFRDMPSVLATAMMIAFIEETCIMGLRPYLAAGHKTVGTHVDVSHVAATPVGMVVTAEIELTRIEGKSLFFRVICRDESGVIGEGLHRRAIIDEERFNRRVQEKANQARGS